jgi:RNA:NAD 2'-phosphotransferase (TPT1/KptA family)
MIAGALGEPRFELDGRDIRASYGHSLAVAIKYEKKHPPVHLFHATPLENLSSIFEAQSGLLRGKRQWVHLTDSPLVAINASHRQGKAVAVLCVDTALVDGVVFASGHTWLAPKVAFGAMKVLTLTELDSLLSKEEGMTV